MKKIKNFLKEISKSVLILFLYMGLSIILSALFNGLISSKNFLVSNFSAVLVEIIVLLTLIIIYRKKMINDFKAFKNNFKKIMDLAFKNWVLGLLIMLISNIIISMIIGNIASNEEINRTLLLSTPIYAIIAMVLIAPITEEIVFRLAPRKAFSKKIPYLIYSALLFGGLHLLSSTSLIELLYIIPYGALGFFFSKAYYETDNIFSSISVHMLHNTIAVIVAYIALLG